MTHMSVWIICFNVFSFSLTSTQTCLCSCQLLCPFASPCQPDLSCFVTLVSSLFSRSSHTILSHQRAYLHVSLYQKFLCTKQFGLVLGCCRKTSLWSQCPTLNNKQWVPEGPDSQVEEFQAIFGVQYKPASLFPGISSYLFLQWCFCFTCDYVTASTTCLQVVWLCVLAVGSSFGDKYHNSSDHTNWCCFCRPDL